MADSFADIPFSPGRTLVIHNPLSGRRTGQRRASELVGCLREKEYHVTQTRGPGNATELGARAAEDGFTAVICIGGDGTLYETVALLSHAVAVGFFPTGTINLFARNLRIPNDPQRWLQLLESQTMREAYFGRCNDRPFTSVGSVGFDAWVVARVTSGLKQRLNKAAYAIRAALELPRYRPPRYRVSLDGHPVEKDLLGVIVGKGAHFAGPHPVLKGADPFASNLRVALLGGNGRLSLLRYGIGVMLGTLPGMKGVMLRTVSEVAVSCMPESNVELDGDAFGVTPVTFTVDQSPRRVLAP